MREIASKILFGINHILDGSTYTFSREIGHGSDTEKSGINRKKGVPYQVDKFKIFEEISERTKGDIYIGVVGPVRTGKSTFIKRFMEELVIPMIDNEYDKNRSKDELPQSAAGKTIMTTEPKFVPAEAVHVTLKDHVHFSVRLVDCVGYAVEGANGYEDEEGERMVLTPWNEEPISFEKAAEIGTRKVIEDHSTIGLVMTTDGSVTGISREGYVNAEERVIRELKEIKKPFIVVLNSVAPYSDETTELKRSLEEKYGVPVVPADVLHLNRENMVGILNDVLKEFPVGVVKVFWPQWVNMLDNDHWFKEYLMTKLKEEMVHATTVREIEECNTEMAKLPYIESVALSDLDMGKGEASVVVKDEEGMFYKILEEVTGIQIEDDLDLMKSMQNLSRIKTEYDRIKDALEDVNTKGYGLVAPSLDQLKLEEPEIITRGNQFGLKLKASAPTLHFIRADITTEVSPFVGTEKQAKDLIDFLSEQFEENPAEIWHSNIFGKTLHDIVKEGLQNKLHNMPESAQAKLQETLTRIVNEGSGGLICIIF